MKICTGCGEEKSEDDFYSIKKPSPRKVSKCRKCHVKATIANRNKNPARRDANVLRSRYGLEVIAYVLMLEDQNYRCAICSRVLTSETRRGELGRACIDHCHTTGAIRKVLCQNCNWVLGLVYDNPETLRKAASYLEEYK